MKLRPLAPWPVWAACLFAATARAQVPEGGAEPRFAVPEGLSASVWAESPALYNPTCIDVDRRGRVWVAEGVNYRTWDGRNPGRRHAQGDRIVILADLDGDGRAEESKVFVQDVALVAPLGLAVIGERVYVSSSPNVFCYVDEDGDDVPERRETFLTGFGGPDHDHGVHSLVAGPDGRLWFNVGNAGPHIVTDAAGWTLRSGSLYDGGGPTPADNKPGLVSSDGRVWTGGLALRVGQDGRGLEVLAHNFRNSYELALDSFGNVFQTDNDDDGNAACRALWCLGGANHGYGSADGSRSWWADRRPGQTTERAHWHADDPGVAPSGAITGAGGPAGSAIYEGELLAEWLYGALLAADAGAGLVYAHVPEPAGAGFALRTSEFLKPVLGPDDARWFRPSDVAVGQDGAVYVSDWHDPAVGGHAAGDREAFGRILRVAPAERRVARMHVEAERVEDAMVALASPAINVRELGRRALSKDSELAREVLAKFLAKAHVRPELRARALWVLVLAHGRRDLALESLADAAAPAGLRIAALRALAAADGGRVAAELLRERGLARDASPALRREVALQLRGLALEPKLDLLLELAERFDGADRAYLEAFGLAAEGPPGDAEAAAEGDALYAALAAELGGPPLEWDARFEGLAWRLHPRAAIPDLLARAASAELPLEARKRALDALAFLPDRAAAEAVLVAALSGPEDARAYASWWIEDRETNAWRDFGLAAELGERDFAGAELAWQSEVVRSGSVRFDVPLAGAAAVWLAATDAGDGNACDWADWIDVRFEGAAEGEVIARLVDLPWIAASAEWGSVQIDRNCAGGELAVDARGPQSGIGAHAAAHIGWKLPAGAERLVGEAGADLAGSSQQGGAATSIVFEVWLKRAATAAPIEEWEATLLDESAAHEQRRAAASQLALDPRGGLRVLELARSERVPELFRDALTAGLHANPDMGVRALASEFFAPPSGSELPPLAQLAELEGDAENGRRLFEDRARTQCATCHAFRLGDTAVGGDSGPELTHIREKYDARALLETILYPSAGIALGYETWLVETADGSLHAGFVIADGATLVLKDAQGARRVIPAADVVARRKQALSAMPSGAATGLSAQELADLVAFLREDPAAPPVFEAERELFDGESFAGWIFHSDDPSARLADVWSIAGGVLRTSGAPAGYLRTRERFESFALSLEWRFDPALGAGNSGVLLRRTGPDRVWPRSIEAQLHAGDAGDIWNIGDVPLRAEPARTSGRRTARMQPSSEKPLGEWNRYDILLDGPRLELFVNGVLQNTADWCEEVPGEIALQAEGAAVEFRNIVLRPIAR